MSPLFSIKLARAPQEVPKAEAHGHLYLAHRNRKRSRSWRDESLATSELLMRRRAMVMRNQGEFDISVDRSCNSQELDVYRGQCWIRVFTLGGLMTDISLVWNVSASVSGLCIH